MMSLIRKNHILIFLTRLLAVYLLFGFCRVGFALYNSHLIGPIAAGDIFSIIRGGFVFDSASIFYANMLLLLFSLLPLHLRDKRWYGMALIWMFVVINALALTINIADICYYPFKLSRIASDDLHFASESNFTSLMGTFVIEYWGAMLLWIGCIVALIFVARFTLYSNKSKVYIHPIIYYPLNTLVLIAMGLFSIFAVRGFVYAHGTYPIAMSDVTIYVKPQYASLTLSNPFCMIRTIGQQYNYPEYMDQAMVDSLVPTMHLPVDSAKVRLNGQPNIVFLVLESIATPHIKSLSDQFAAERASITPNLDSIAALSYLFTNSYHNGTRSIDALPSIWASIPSFKTQFLTLPQSVAEYYALPAALRDNGYTTMFFHGAVRESMSFVSFGRSAGVEEFFTREDYEQERGTADYDGSWGIFDHKFLPYVESKLDQTKQPFCATIFTLSSHHPYRIPDELQGRFKEGTMPIHIAISYADYALGEFFRSASQQPWYNNTLFVITADHGSGADNDKYTQPPYNYAVPIIFFYPGGDLKGRDDRVMQHINIAPTLMRMLGHQKPFFGFGRDVFNDPNPDYAIYYNNGAFNFVGDSLLYRFNEKTLIDTYNYRNDYVDKHNIETRNKKDSLNLDRMKAFIQQYYRHVGARRFK